MGGTVFPPCYLAWGQTMVEVTKIMVTSFKRSHAHTAALSAPSPAAGHSWPTPMPETPGYSRASLGQSLVSPWNSPGQNTRVDSLSLLQGIFPTQGSNPGLPHCRQILYQLSHKGTPRTLEWVAYPISSRSSQPKNQTGVSCIAHGFFTKGAIRETQDILP